MSRSAAVTVVLFIVLAGGCTRHEVEMKPVEVKPIHITVDVNVRIEKAVEDFYGDIYGDQSEQKTEQQKGN